MRLGSIFLLTLLLLQKGFAQEGSSFEERIEQIQEQRGYIIKKRPFQGIVEGDLLYWKADVDGVAYETTTVLAPALDEIPFPRTHFKTRTPHFSYDPGFRLTLGLQSPFDLFDLCLVWTRFYTQGKDKAEGILVNAIPVPGDKLISQGIGLIQSLLSVPEHASVVCGIKENLLDVQLARGVKISHYFFLRPYFGVRAVWSDLHWKISLNRTFVIPESFNQDSTRQKVKNDFRAAGGLIGLELDWKMPYGLGVNMRGAGALVYGLTEEKTEQHYTLLPSLATTSLEQDFHARNSFYSVKGLLELFTGVFWDSRMGKKKSKKEKDALYLRFFVGYEFQQWPNNAQKTNTQITRQRERFSLGFQGFTGGARCVF